MAKIILKDSTELECLDTIQSSVIGFKCDISKVEELYNALTVDNLKSFTFIHDNGSEEHYANRSVVGFQFNDSGTYFNLNYIDTLDTRLADIESTLDALLMEDLDDLLALDDEIEEGEE